MQAQLQQPKRYEIILHDNEPSFSVTPAKENGLFLYRYLTGADFDQIELVRLDTGFNQLWHGALSVNKNLMLVGRKAEQEFIYFLLRNQTDNNFELYELEQATGRYHKYEIRSFIRFNPTEFQVTREAVIVGGYFNRIPLVLHFNLISHQSKILPGLFNEEGELTQIKTYPDGSFQVLVSARSRDRQKSLWIKDYNPEGMLLDNYALRPDDRKNLLFARSIKTTNNMEIVAGVYGRHNSEYSRGMFIATVDPSGLQHIKYYNYGDLRNFFKYMKVRREIRVKERIERRKVRGKKVKFNYRLLVHELIEHNDQYILLGEAFYPQYTSVSRSSYNGFFTPYTLGGNSMIRGDQVFDGYRYTHAVILGFDRNGKLLWDNSFEINDIKTFTLDQFVRLEVEDDKIVLLYLFDNQIRSKIIQNDQVLEGKTVDPLRTSFEQDVAVKDRNGANQLNYWYGEFFYATGTQNIINAVDAGVLPQRRVFFINKISYKGK